MSDLARLSEADQAGPKSVLIDGPRGIGKTELLRQLYTLLFWKQKAVVPFLYSVSPALSQVDDFARDYLSRFLCQWFGFSGQDQSLVLAEGIGLDELHTLALLQNAEWAAILLDRFRSPSATPLDRLRTALHAPRSAVSAAGRPVVVLIDDFHLLAGLRRGPAPEPQLTALFSDLLVFPKTPYFVTGVASAIDELQLPVLTRYPLGALVLSDAELLIRSLLRERQMVPAPVPQGLLLRLGGNPRYLRSVAASVQPDSGPQDRAYWDAYRREVQQGMIARHWRAVLRTVFPEPAERRPALEAVHAVTCRERPPGTAWTDRSLQTLAPTLTPSILNALGRNGLVQSEFGTVRPIEDPVLRDVISALYVLEVQGGTPDDVTRSLSIPLDDKQRTSFKVDLLLPHAPEAELLAAQCLEQLGKNRNIPADVIGQLQIALIEACINALEHGSGDRPVPVSIEADEGRIVVSVSTSGRDFVLDATGEPATIPHPDAEPQRGWGVTLMKRFCDTVRFEHNPQGTTVVLVKQWSPAGGTHAKESGKREQLHPFSED